MGNNHSTRSQSVKPLPQVNLADYESACKSDPAVRKFDESLHTRTTEALSSLADGVDKDGGLSFESLKVVTTSLFKVDQEVVDIILSSKEDVWANEELKHLVDEYFECTLEALGFCTVLDNDVKRSEEKLDILQVAFNLMPPHGKPSKEECDKVLKELRDFVQAANPFSEDFNNQFKKVYDRHLAMQLNLQARKKKLDSRLRTVKGWTKVSNVILAASYAALFICSVVAAAVCAPFVALGIAEESRKPSGSMGSWFKPLCTRYEEQIKAQQAIQDAFSSGTYVTIQDLNTIKAQVHSLEIKLTAIKENVGFAGGRPEDPSSLQFVVEAIRKKQAMFIEQLGDLKKSVETSRQHISVARTTVVRRILEPGLVERRGMKDKVCCCCGGG